MKLNEQPYHFWTDTRTDAIERQKIEYITRDFRKTLRDTGVSYCLYGLTINSKERLVRDAGIWFDDDARNGLLGSIYNQFIHRVSGTVEPNYKRNTHAQKRFLSWGVIEHLSRDKSSYNKDGILIVNRVAPHIHATVAVHPDWEDEFLSCFQRNICRDDFSLSQDFVDGGMTNWMKRVSSVLMKPIWDEYEWSGYCLKQVSYPTKIDDCHKCGTGLFSHNGLTSKPITETEEDLPMRLTKNAVITDINQSHSVDAVRISKDELPADKNKRVNDLKREIDRKLRQKKDLTIVIVEQVKT